MGTRARSCRNGRVGGAGRIRGGGAGRRRSVHCPLLAALALSGCGLFDEAAEDQRRLRELELELIPKANGAEHLAQVGTGLWVLYQELLADVLQEADALNTISGGWSVSALVRWHQARNLASHVEARLYEELDSDQAESHELMAQTRWTTALAELYLGMTFCGVELDGVVLSDTQVLWRAEQSLGLAIETAGRVNASEYLAAARAARAQARMLLEDWAGAETDAALVPEGFVYVSYRNAANPNPLWTLTSSPIRRYGFLHKWWALVPESEDPGFMIDPSTGEEDPRIPAHFQGGTLGNSDVPHYRPLKYTSEEDDIPIVHYDMAQLIIAEARAVGGDYRGRHGRAERVAGRGRAFASRDARVRGRDGGADPLGALRRASPGGAAAAGPAPQGFDGAGLRGAGRPGAPGSGQAVQVGGLRGGLTAPATAYRKLPKSTTAAFSSSLQSTRTEPESSAGMVSNG